MQPLDAKFAFREVLEATKFPNGGPRWEFLPSKWPCTHDYVLYCLGFFSIYFQLVAQIINYLNFLFLSLSRGGTNPLMAKLMYGLNFLLILFSIFIWITRRRQPFGIYKLLRRDKLSHRLCQWSWALFHFCRYIPLSKFFWQTRGFAVGSQSLI